MTRRIRLYGIVQGVGFRPTVSRHAMKCGITGSVCNKGPYVEVMAQGTPEQLEAFESLLENEPPKMSSVIKTESKIVENAPTYMTFDIIESEKTKGEVFISPDLAICEDCERELFDPKNRRYLHPFINCTCCGPRLTILEHLPYDRERTSMKIFPMCRECALEYKDPSTRRYDAQPVCCSTCGPHVYALAGGRCTSDECESVKDIGRTIFENGENIKAEVKTILEEGEAVNDIDRTIFKNGEDIKAAGRIISRDGEAICAARKVISRGGIVAVKGIGGFHLCCDATSDEAVGRLREIKHRPVKPFAVMAKDISAARRECETGDSSGSRCRMLTGRERPIVLLEKKEGGRVCGMTAPDNPKLGIMLPYAPIHHLLFTYPDGISMPDVLVMTSGNVSGAPICKNDEEAMRDIAGFCDLILSHDRPIELRADDSVVDFFENEPYMVRRSRGFAPLPLVTSFGYRGNVLSAGGDLKNNICLTRDGMIYPSPYIGDMEDLRSAGAMAEAMERMMMLLDSDGEVLVTDLHPKYHSVENAVSVLEKKSSFDGKCILKVQHHYAHILSCLAENDYEGKVIGVSYDGTGFGPDETIWGGEILVADTEGFYRAASIMPFFQAGGDASAKEGWRIACSLLAQEAQPEENVSAEHTAVDMNKNMTAAVSLTADEHNNMTTHADTAVDMNKNMTAAVSLTADEHNNMTVHADMTMDANKNMTAAVSLTVGEHNNMTAHADVAVDKRKNMTSSAKPAADVFEKNVVSLGLCDERTAKVQYALNKQRINGVMSTSVGRLFDAVSAVLGLCRESTFEGEAAQKLQAAAERYAEGVSVEYADPNHAAGAHFGHNAKMHSDYDAKIYSNHAAGAHFCRNAKTHSDYDTKIHSGHAAESYPMTIKQEAALTGSCGGDDQCDARGSRLLMNTTQLFHRIVCMKEEGVPVDELAFYFHAQLAKMTADACRRICLESGIGTAALSGGVFQNTLLLGLVKQHLLSDGFCVLHHHLIPPNDGGLAVGQALYGLAHLSK